MPETVGRRAPACKSVVPLTCSCAEWAKPCYAAAMIPAFTIITTIITVAVTGLLVFVLYRLNLPMRDEVRRDRPEGG